MLSVRIIERLGSFRLRVGSWRRSWFFYGYLSFVLNSSSSFVSKRKIVIYELFL